MQRPVDHVFRDGVSPAHVSPDAGLGIVLEEHVVAAVEVDGRTGIVHPATGGGQMVARAQRVGVDLGLRWEAAVGAGLLCEGEAGEEGGGTDAYNGPQHAAPSH